MKSKVVLGLPAMLAALLATAQEPRPRVPLSEMILTHGGGAMYVLLAMSFVAVFLSLYFVFTLRLNALMPKRFRLEAEEMAAKGDVEALYLICQTEGSAGARIIGSAARALHDNPQAEYAIIRDIIDDEGGRQSSTLWQRIQYLMDIAVVAPMVGLLGTVLGMIQAFVGLRESFGGVKPIELTNGVSKALITTAGGLAVGIAAMLLYAYFRGRVSGLVTQLEEYCSGMLQSFVLNRPPTETESRKESP